MIKRKSGLGFTIKERLLWWRTFCPVIFAHKPLCQKFSKHIIKIGSVYVCRSCCWLYLGMIVFSFLLFFYPSEWVGNKIVMYVGVMSILVFSFPPLFAKLPRFVCEALRFCLGGVVALILVNAWYQEYISAGIIMVMLLMARVIYNRLRRIVHQNVCDTCEEYTQKDICSGFQLKAQKIREYEQQLENF